MERKGTVRLKPSGIDTRLPRAKYPPTVGVKPSGAGAYEIPPDGDIYWGRLFGQESKRG
jgi:hypothetical protein